MALDEKNDVNCLTPESVLIGLPQNGVARRESGCKNDWILDLVLSA